MFSKFFHKFSCEYYTQLSSKNLNNGLSVKEKALYLLHHFICTFCRRFSRQIKVIEQGLKMHRDEEDKIANNITQNTIKLDEARKASIKESLSKI